MKALIIANGNIKNPEHLLKLISRADLVICADGGTNHLEKIKIVPHIIIGDLDSINTYGKTLIKKNIVKLIQYPGNKDATDTELAALYAVEQGAFDITFTGVTGTRLDHTLANIFLLKQMADINIKSRIIDDNNKIFLVQDKTIIKKNKDSFISLLPLTAKVEGITTTGLEYELNNAEMQFGISLGISNRFKEDTATVSIKKGILIAAISRD